MTSRGAEAQARGGLGVPAGQGDPGALPVAAATSFPGVAGSPAQPAPVRPEGRRLRRIIAWRPSGLWRHPEFLKLWSGRTVSLFGSEITDLALPLTAAVTLGATAGQMGLLQAVGRFPPLVLGLFAGVWVDRVRRRPILIVCDLGRAVVLGAIPVLALTGRLRLGHLVAVAALAALFSLFFDLAASSFIPSFLSRRQLVDGNGKLATSGNVAQIAGAGAAGAIVQALTAPVAIVCDAFTFLFSALCYGLIRVPEPDPDAGVGRPAGGLRGMGEEILQGLQVVRRNPYMRSNAGTAGVFNFFAGVFFAVYVLYVTRQLGVGAPLLGLFYAAGGAGGVLGGLLAGPLTRRLGFGRATFGAACLVGGGWLPAAFAGAVPSLLIVLLPLAHFLRGASQTVYGINAVSLRQTSVADHLQGRVGATLRVIGAGTMPLGSLLGGVLGERLGLWPTVAVGAAGALLGTLWMALSPVPGLRDLPGPGAQ